MRMEHIMDYKIYLYIFFSMLSAFALSGINYEKIIRKNRIWETRILVLILSLILGYLLTQFVSEFL